MEQFSISSFNERVSLVQELIETSSTADLNLGSKNHKLIKNLDFDWLDKENISISPVLDITQIKEEIFNDKNIEITPYLKGKFEDYLFYYIRIPITLYPKSGWAFTNLECKLNLCSNESDYNNCPVIHDIFPHDVWSDLFHVTNYANIGLDETLNFKLSTEFLDHLITKSGLNLSTAVLGEIKAKQEIVFGPFTYNVRRAKIIGRGRGNVVGFWRLEGKDYIDKEDLTLGVVVLLPKKANSILNIEAEIRVSHQFQMLSAKFKEWFSFFSIQLQKFINDGAPLHQKMSWKVELNS
jgi:hypothetical protein